MKRSETPSAARTVNVNPEKWVKWIDHCTLIYGSVSARVRQVMEADITGKTLGGGNEFTLEMLEQKQVNLVLEKRKLTHTFMEKNNKGQYVFNDDRWAVLVNIAEELGLQEVKDGMGNLDAIIPKLLDYKADTDDLKDDLIIFIRMLRVFKQLRENKIAIKAELIKKSDPELNKAPKSDKDSSGKSNEEPIN